MCGDDINVASKLNKEEINMSMLDPLAEQLKVKKEPYAELDEVISYVKWRLQDIITKRDKDLRYSAPHGNIADKERQIRYYRFILNNLEKEIKND